MDIFSIGYSLTLFLIPFIIFILLAKEEKHGRYSKTPWYAFVKKIISIRVITNFLRHNRVAHAHGYEAPVKLKDELEEDVHMIYGTDQEGNSIYLKFSTRINKIAEVSLQIRLQSGEVFQLPNEPEVLLCSIRRKEWKAKRLSIECVEPQKIYRITYNGYVKDNKHIRLNLIWTAASEPILYPGGYSRSLFSDAIAKEPWRDGDWLRLLGDRAGYDQFGCVFGEIQGSAVQGRKTINVPTIRKRYVGTADKLTCHRDFAVFISSEDGTLINVGTRCLKKGCTDLKYGSVLYSNGIVRSITYNDISLEDIGEYEHLPRAFTLSLKTKRSSIKCLFHVYGDSHIKTFSNEQKGWSVVNATAECNIDMQQGRAFITSWYAKKGQGVEVPTPLVRQIDYIDSDQLVVSLNNEECKCPKVAGERGTSLALLHFLHSEEFIVPDSFVITSKAFWKHVEHISEVKLALRDMLLNFEKSKEFEESCNLTSELLAASQIADDIQRIVLLKINKHKSKSDEKDKIKWAVYCSSKTVSEIDIIICKSVAEVLTAVCKVWSLAYSYNSVKERIAKGETVFCDVSVIIQMKVECNAEGVLTPYRGDELDISKMCIDFDYGLENGALNNQYAATLERSDNGGFKLEYISDELLNSDVKLENLLSLGKIHDVLEHSFGVAYNIYWSFSKDHKIIINQIEEVTAFSEWTDKELEHEMDDCILSENEIYTKANVKEVMPKAMTVLSNTIIRTIMSDSWEKIMIGKTNPFVNLGFVSLYHHTFINVLNMIWKFPPETIGVHTLISDLVMFGYPVTSELVKERACDRNGSRKVMNKKQMLKDLMFFACLSRHSYRKLAALSKKELATMKGMTLREIQHSIDDYIKVIKEIAKIHYTTWRINIIYHLLTLFILIGDDEECTPDHYHDIAIIFSSSKKVISADIPKAIEKIASVVRNTGKANQFALLTAEEVPQWLEENAPGAHKHFQKFFSMHGYRAFQEYELMDESWSQNPNGIIQAIQTVSNSEHVGRKLRDINLNNTIRKLKTHRGPLETTLLKVLIAKCRNTISRQEHTKSELAKAIDKLRKGYRWLAKNLVTEGHLPREELIFHLSKYEVKQLTMARQPQLIEKAIKREELYDVWDHHELDDWYFITYPTDCHKVTGNVNGLPICLSDVTARCCNVLEPEDFGDIRSGDILVTKSIDIRWYPYFPMLSAVVVESGGLISHGIVAAREFGLPCLTGVKNATQKFKTGDIGILSTKTGTFEIYKEIN